MTDTAIVPSGNNMLAQWGMMRQQADILVKSGFLPKAVKTAEQAIAIMMMGDALNIAHIVALNTINVIAGKPTVPPQLMLALVRRSGQLESFKVYDENDTATVEIKRKGEPLHIERFSQDDARKLMTTEWENGNSKSIPLADKANWRQQPKNMRKWRCVSAACRIIFPDVIWGIASYTPDEMGANVTYDDEGNVLTIEEPAQFEAPRTEVIDSEPPAQQTTPQPAEPPRQQPKNGNGHQAWYGVPENVKTIKSWLADREITMDAAVKLVGPFTEFSTGSAFTDAVTAAIGKPAQPKNPPKPEEPELHWSQKGEEIAALADFLTRFDDMRTAEAMKRLKVDTWRVYATRDAAQEAIRKIAFEQCWNMRAYAVKYEPKDSGSSRIVFETPLPVVWFAGRHELIEAVAEAQKNWQEILVWEKAGTYTLPEPVRIEVAVKGDHLEITHIVSAVGIPF